MADDKEIPIANPVDYDDNKTLYQFQFGAYADTKVYVWADGDDDAFEIAVEWADDNAKGVFTTLDEDDLRESAEDLGIEWDEMWSDGGARGRKKFGSTWSPNDDRDYNKIVEHAEADLTVVGWTQLNSGTHVISYEIHFHEVVDDEEFDEVAVRSENDEDDEGEDDDDDEEDEEHEADEQDIAEGFGDYFKHEGHDIEVESKRLAKMISGANNSDKVDAVLEEANRLLDGSGVEAIRGDRQDNYYGDTVALYVNMGDTYNTTLLYDTENDRFLVTSYGDWVEKHSDEYGIQ